VRQKYDAQRKDQQQQFASERHTITSQFDTSAKALK